MLIYRLGKIKTCDRWWTGLSRAQPSNARMTIFENSEDYVAFERLQLGKFSCRIRAVCFSGISPKKKEIGS